MELLERHIVIRRRHCATGHIFDPPHAVHILSNASTTAAAKKSNSLSHDLGNIAFGAGFIVVAPRANTAFDENLASLGQVLSAALALFTPHHDVVPLRA